MRLQVYRLASVDQALARVARYMRDLYRGNDAHPDLLRPCVAYESAELAAMSSPELLWSVRRKVEVLRETIALPLDSALHGHAPAALGIASYDGTSALAGPILDFMMAQDLLTLWLPSSHAPAQHAIFINPCHAAFERIDVTKRQVLLTRPAWTGHMQVPPAANPTAQTPESATYVQELLPDYLSRSTKIWRTVRQGSLQKITV